ncbi:MAG: MerR family transcriptional regulator [Bacteroidales bacterium]|nr:MerR family transcriptional regulator [Bacteroidales bacterium]
MNQKLYYSIGEVSRMLDVKPSLLRFWETEFPSIRPHKNNKGTRYYTPSDIALLRHIYHLTRDCGYTLDGVREQLRVSDNLDEKMQIVQTLTEARQFLVSLKEIL